MIRVGFWFDYGLVYAGGLNYFRNLLQAIHVARQDDVQTVLFISKDLPAALEEEFQREDEERTAIAGHYRTKAQQR